MAKSRLELTKAGIFDIGETIGRQLEISPTHYYLQFVRQICRDVYTFSDEEILAAVELSDEELLTRRARVRFRIPSERFSHFFSCFEGCS